MGFLISAVGNGEKRLFCRLYGVLRRRNGHGSWWLGEVSNLAKRVRRVNSVMKFNVQDPDAKYIVGQREPQIKGSWGRLID